MTYEHVETWTPDPPGRCPECGSPLELRVRYRASDEEWATDLCLTCVCREATWLPGYVEVSQWWVADQGRWDSHFGGADWRSGWDSLTARVIDRLAQQGRRALPTYDEGTRLTDMLLSGLVWDHRSRSRSSMTSAWMERVLKWSLPPDPTAQGSRDSPVHRDRGQSRRERRREYRERRRPNNERDTAHSRRIRRERGQQPPWVIEEPSRRLLNDLHTLWVWVRKAWPEGIPPTSPLGVHEVPDEVLATSPDGSACVRGFITSIGDTFDVREWMPALSLRAGTPERGRSEWSLGAWNLPADWDPQHRVDPSPNPAWPATPEGEALVRSWLAHTDPWLEVTRRDALARAIKWNPADDVHETGQLRDPWLMHLQVHHDVREATARVAACLLPPEGRQEALRRIYLATAMELGPAPELVPGPDQL